jgi:hypothetical protein
VEDGGKELCHENKAAAHADVRQGQAVRDCERGEKEGPDQRAMELLQVFLLSLLVGEFEGLLLCAN